MPAVSFADMFDEIVALLLVATVIGILALRLRQPLIIGFIAVGILAGPSALDWIRSVVQIHALAEMGLALLLFVVGLKLDVHLLRNMGRVALAAGLGQVLVTSVGGFLIAFGLGMDLIASGYIAVALAFSSTIIIVKLLTDKREADSLHGRLSLGVLIVQDLLVVLAMLLLSAFSGGSSEEPVRQVLMIVVKGIGLLVAVWLMSSLLLPRLLPLLATSAELLLLFGILWALGLANLGEALGFSKEIGAFVAGVSLASTPFRESIGARLISLRDFLLVFFFVELGTRLEFGLLGRQVWAAIPLCVFVLIAKPLITMGITAALGYRKRTSVLTGVTLGQVSEFSLILIAMGEKLGHIGEGVVAVVTLVALVTIALSTYMILYSQSISRIIVPYLGAFERRGAFREDAAEEAHRLSGRADALVFGLGGYGTGIAEELEGKGKRVLGVDFDPQSVLSWRARGREAVFGDATDPDVIGALHLDGIHWVVSSIPNNAVNLALLHSLQLAGYSGYTAVPAYDRPAAETLAAFGTDLILSPFSDAAVQAADLIFSKEAQIARRAMDRLIDSMKDHYVVCGFGRMGQQILKDLTEHGVPGVVVESNPEQLPKLRDGNIPHVEGQASEDGVLLKAGIQRAKGLIAVAASDEENVFIVLTARVLNPRLFIVARSILKENEDKLRHAGADMVVSPYILGGRRMAAAVIKPEVMDFLDLVVHSDGLETEMAKIVVAPGSSFARKTLRDANLWETCNVTLLAVRRQGESLHANPSPDLLIMPGDEMILMGTPAQIDAARRMLSAAE